MEKPTRHLVSVSFIYESYTKVIFNCFAMIVKLFITQFYLRLRYTLFILTAQLVGVSCSTKESYKHMHSLLVHVYPDCKII